MRRVALLTCEPLPEPDPDFAPLRDALAALGAHAEAVPWRDPGFDPVSWDAVVVRATWDYHLDPELFVAMLERAASASTLVNPLSVCLGNVDKAYLLELAASGVPVVETARFARGSAPAVPDGWEGRALVVKPAISCGSWNTRMFEPGDEEAMRFAAYLATSRDVLVQPARVEFADPGERSLVWIDGEVRHAIVKRPRFAGEDESTAPHAPISERERAFAERVVATLPARPVFARVDCIEGPEGLELSELEALEPSLFFRHYPDAAHVLAEAIVGAIPT